MTLLNISGAIATFAIGLTDNVQSGLIFFIVSFVCIYLAEMVYNTLLSDASTSSNRGKIGGIAIGVGNSGSLVVIAFALLAPGTSGNYSFEFKMIAVFFLLTALPITIFFKESHDFDIVGALVHQTPDRATDLVGAVRHFVAHVEMTAATGDRPTRYLHAGSGDIAARQRLLDREADLVAGAVLAQGGDTGVEVPAQIIGTREHHHFVALGEHFDVGVAIAG